MDKKLTETFNVHTYETDITGRLTLPALAGFMQDIAGTHATKLGCGFNQLREVNVFWALSKMYIEFDKYPVQFDDFFITTWHKKNQTAVALRDFLMEDINRNIIGRATSAWLVVDLTNRRIQRPETVCSNELSYEADAINKDMKKLDYSKMILEKKGEITPQFSDIDVNKHVNNANYIKWALDYLPVDLSIETVKNIEINFVSEVKLGDTFGIYYANETNKWFCEMRNGTGNVHCRCSIEIKQDIA